ncbi:cyclic nucleotide-binding domain-containing protein [Starkeya sp. 3C]|uniref:Cyclic nucleotide-binding domain-containing protein n=1 Tax=Ancylobacter moscoviensis TaxID=2597768 RepID=A0ABY3DWZ6_9HYPH|nr:helix-turn-helix domain-containing protein [Ancylobacter moscoviensis]TSJ64695.1 cyclic nucleotide-binding domain-containing protein [Ancylobacter moscoviensis]
MRQIIEERTGSPTRQPAFVEPHCSNLRVAAHVTVLHEGDPARRIMEVVEGAVMLTKLLPDGRRQVVELLGPGDVFGLAHDDAYACSAETLTPATITTHERSALERDPMLASRLLRHFEAQLCVMHSHALVLGRMSALERVAFFLLRLMPEGMVGGGTLHLSMTRQEIADFLGLTLETVSRAFSELKRRGLVALQRADEVRIQDRGSMRRLAGAL